MAVFTETGLDPTMVAQFPSAAIAERGVAARQTAGQRRRIPMRMRIIEEMKNKQKIHIFNVGPWAQMVNTGSTGSFFIPACPEGTPYVELLAWDGDRNSSTFGQMVPPISVIMDELIIKSEDEMTRLEEDGRKFAESMIGIGPSQNPDFALTRFGIFVAAGDKPTDEELAKAHEALNEECRQTVRYAADIYATDRATFSRVVRPAVHFVAAHVLGRDNPVDSPWMLEAAPVGRLKCKVCGRICEPDVAMCEGGHIINEEKYIEYKLQEERIMGATKPKVK